MAPTKPVFAVVDDVRLAHPSRTNAAGVPANEIQLCEHCYSASVTVNTAWVTTHLDDHWTAALRLAPQNGQAVVAEVRVYPTEPDQWLGEWSGVLRGTDAEVPRGGLRARLLHEIRLGDLHVQGTETMVWLEREVERQRIALQRSGEEVSPPVFDPDGVLGSVGFRRPRGKRRRGPGRPGRAPLECARIAKLYAAACARGSRRPVVDVAEKLKRDTVQVRDILHRARTLGLLTRPVKDGEGGGTLTDKARALIAPARPPKTPKTRKARKGVHR